MEDWRKHSPLRDLFFQCKYFLSFFEDVFLKENFDNLDKILKFNATFSLSTYEPTNCVWYTWSQSTFFTLLKEKKNTALDDINLFLHEKIHKINMQLDRNASQLQTGGQFFGPWLRYSSILRTFTDKEPINNWRAWLCACRYLFIFTTVYSLGPHRRIYKHGLNMIRSFQTASEHQDLKRCVWGGGWLVP